MGGAAGPGGGIFQEKGAAFSVRRGAAPYFLGQLTGGGGCVRFEIGSTSSQRLGSPHNIGTIGKNEGPRVL